MRHSVVGRKAFQLYAVLMLGLFLYLHYYRYGAGRAIVLHREQGTPGSSGPPNLLSDQAPQQPEGVPQQPAGRSRFIMGLNYWEQFTMATANLLSLVCLGNSWNATIVQPFTFNSRLYGLPNFKPGKWRYTPVTLHASEGEWFKVLTIKLEFNFHFSNLVQTI